jgi:amino-acid N-acetyltransferase
MTSDLAFERADPADEAAIIALLRACSLPTEDLTAGLPHFFVAKSGSSLVGCVGLELFGANALFRSLAVMPAWRGRGVSVQLWQRARQEAIGRGAEQIFLLTTTAEPLFARWGFQRSARDAAPAGIRESREFTGLCPSTAVFMRIAAR